jgi:elongation factor Ts
MTSQITASMVKDLREMTGAGMMDCKGALAETGGDMQAAVDYLRKKGLSKAAKKAGRIAAEGLIAALVADNKGVVVEVNSETDFVARNDLFQGLVKMIAQVALDVGDDVETIKAAKVGNNNIPVADAIADSVAKVGENMSLRRAASLRTDRGVVSSYVHNSLGDGLGKIGVIVALESPGNTEALSAFGRQVAMHVASANPQAVDAAALDPAVVQRERAILAEKAKEQGKPANVVDKIVESGIKTFYKEVCLVDQPFIFDDKKTVAQAAKEAENKAGGPIKIAGFVRYAVGEGIERSEQEA